MKPFKAWFLVVMLVFSVLLLAACGGSAAVTPDKDVPEPSNPGGPGKALTLTGDAVAGEKIFSTTCAGCHGPQGTGGVANPGGDENVPALNPADEFYNADPAVFAANLDPFIEHGSKPDGDKPALVMAPYGDEGTLTPQQIADVLAYIISLNKK